MIYDIRSPAEIAHADVLGERCSGEVKYNHVCRSRSCKRNEAIFENSFADISLLPCFILSIQLNFTICYIYYSVRRSLHKFCLTIIFITFFSSK